MLVDLILGDVGVVDEKLFGDWVDCVEVGVIGLAASLVEQFLRDWGFGDVGCFCGVRHARLLICY